MIGGPESAGIGMTSARTRERLVRRLKEKGIRSGAVLDAIRNTPRHLFVDEALASRAYEDTALPIGHGQTISQPYVVAWMTEALLANGIPETVLEIGTGCGYQSAVLASLIPQLYTVERVEPLLSRARRKLRTLGYRNIRYRHSDGTWGWKEQAPFGGILVTASPEDIPQSLLEQLTQDGTMIIPVGPPGRQELLRIRRHAGEYEKEILGLVSFVPLVGGGI